MLQIFGRDQRGLAKVSGLLQTLQVKVKKEKNCCYDRQGYESEGNDQKVCIEFDLDFQQNS